MEHCSAECLTSQVAGALQSDSGGGLQQQQGGWKLAAGREVPSCLLPRLL